MVLYSLTIQYSKTGAPKAIEIMVGMARLELARDSSQRSLSPLRLPIPPHPYARHARSNLLITRQDTPCTTSTRANLVMDEGIAPSSTVSVHENSENIPPASLQ